VDGGQLEGIHYLRTFGNSDAIRADAENAETVVLVGGSFIGTELAASLTAMGKKCSIVMQEQITLERPFGTDVGRFFHGVLTDKGVAIHGGDELERFEGDDRVRRVVTKAGAQIDADLVVIGAGVSPDVTLARGAGLELSDSGGVNVSSQLETSAPGIYAAGDIADYDSVVHGRSLRVEHWDVAFNHGKTAALNMGIARVRRAWSGPHRRTRLDGRRRVHGLLSGRRSGGRSSDRGPLRRPGSGTPLDPRQIGSR
jgi:3-phenylpropionate/trans-cinnamate dioxygenase ferredoxin reductase subunit